jgi:3-dehydroquinate synthase
VNPSTEQTVCVSLGSRTYEILIGSDVLSRAAEFIWRWQIQHLGKPPAQPLGLIVTDEHVAATPHVATVAASLATAGWRCETCVIPAGESSKALDVIGRVYDRLIDLKADRKTTVLAVGGGVVGDAAGFVAATYARGVPFIQIPTTLLADVDSSVGGKVGVNHPHAKNMIGAFYQPFGVLIDTQALTTLPDREYRSGLAEVVKYGVILDADFFADLERDVDGLNQRDPVVLTRVIARCCRLKADIVEKDEFERTGLRSALNYGHTFAHAFEALAGYGQLLHGEAVAIGMICASRLAERRGLIGSDVTHRQHDLLRALKLPTSVPDALLKNPQEIVSRMQLDKKTEAGILRFVLPVRMGYVELIAGIPDADVVAALR